MDGLFLLLGKIVNAEMAPITVATSFVAAPILRVILLTVQQQLLAHWYTIHYTSTPAAAGAHYIAMLLD